MRLAALFSGLVALCVSGSAHAGEVVGKVYDADGLPVANAPLQLGGGAQMVITGDDGSYTFSDVAGGEREIAVVLADGAVQRVWVNVADDGEARRNIFLLSAASVDRALASALNAQAPQVSFSETLDLAEQMARESASRETQSWRWRDLDG